MIEKKTYKCQWCYKEHKSDSTGWIQTCRGYFPAFIMKLTEEEFEQYINSNIVFRSRTKNNTKKNTKDNTRSKKRDE